MRIIRKHRGTGAPLPDAISAARSTKARRETVALLMGPVAVFAAITAFSTQPLLKFVDAWGLVTSGLALGGGILCCSLAYLLAPSMKWVMLLSAVLTIGGIGGVSRVFSNAADLSATSDRLCKLYEAELVSAKPLAKHVPQTFLALGCRTQRLDALKTPAVAATLATGVVNPPPPDPDTAAWNTAYATWALVAATVVLAALTFMVYSAAVEVPRNERRLDREEQKTKARARDLEAEEAVASTVTLVAEIDSFLAAEAKFDQFQMWARINRCHTQMRLIEHFLSTGVLGPGMPFRLSASIQALLETIDALKRAAKQPEADTAALQASRRADGRGTTERAVQRLAEALAAKASHPVDEPIRPVEPGQTVT